MKAAPGTLVSLYYDARETCEDGDYIQTPTGRTYRVESNRIQTKGKHAGRQHIMAVVLEPDEVLPDDVTMHLIVWYRR